MRQKLLPAALAFAVVGVDIAVGQEHKANFDIVAQIPQGGTTSTDSRHSRRALVRGAVYEVELRLFGPTVQTYLQDYARWYLPVDQEPGSGRKLISVLSREIGSEYNLAFLYWYESAYKEGYYCKYLKAFFDYHKADTDFQREYAATRNELGRTGEDADHSDIDRKFAACAEKGPPPIEATETIRKIDQQLRGLAVSERSSWSFAVNPCFVMKLEEGKGTDVDQVETDMKAKDKHGKYNCSRSLLEQAIAK